MRRPGRTTAAPRRRASPRRAAFAALLVLVASVPAATPAGAGARLVAGGAVHGRHDGLRAILRRAGLVDEAGRWSGGGATLVQTGDLFDRGPDVRAVVELMRDLEEQAAAAGGRVEVLLGNHEQMNLVLELRDTSPEAIRRFAGDDAEERRRRALEAWELWRDAWARDREREPPALDAAARERWLEEHPPGLAEYVEALAGDGALGRWLRRRPVARKIDGVLFTHAGIGPEWVGVELAEIDRRYHEAFEAFRAARKQLLAERVIHPLATREEIREILRAYLTEPPSPEHRRPSADRAVARAVAAIDGSAWMFEGGSPLWFRGYAKMSGAELAPHLDALADAYGVERFVAAHSPLASARITPRLDGRLFLIDTGMLASYYDGRASALEIDGGRITALYPDAEELLVAGRPRRRWRGPDGSELPFTSHEEARAFLAAADVVSVRPIPRGVTRPRRVLLEQGEVRAHAAFRDVDISGRMKRLADGTMEMHFVDSFRSDLAAYELSRVLGLDSVPPGVERRLGIDRGAMQLWIEGSTLYADWMEEHPGRRAPTLYLERQLMDMRVFDVLIRNIDRNGGNFLWDAEGHLWLIDHTRSFAPVSDLVGTKWLRGCSRPLWRALRETPEDEIRARLSAWLSKRQLGALLERRDALVALVEAEIAERGEERFLFDYDDPPPGATMEVEGEAPTPEPGRGGSGG